MAPFPDGTLRAGSRVSSFSPAGRDRSLDARSGYDETRFNESDARWRCVNLGMWWSNECGLRRNLGRMDFCGSTNILPFESR
jgi:hypothetical protein